MDWLTFLSGQAAALMIGGVSGGMLGALALLAVWWIDKRESNARELLYEALAIQALKEAWILEGRGYEKERLSTNKRLPTTVQEDGGLWLREVEVRAILDQEEWNAPEDQNQYYTFINGRRTWIIRDKLTGNIPVPKALSGDYLSPHPALISSRGIEELCGWIERVASVGYGHLLSGLSSHGIQMLNPLLLAVMTQDRRDVFQGRVSKKAREFLKEYLEKYQTKKA